MSPLRTSNLCTFPMTGSFTPLFYLYFISIHLLSHISAVPAATPTSVNASEYVLRDVFQNKDTCYQESFVYVKALDAGKSSLFSALTSTKDCSARLNEDVLPDKLPSCPPGLIDLEVMPMYVEKSQISYPYANLNISVMIHSSINTVAFRLQCLSAADGADVYCSDMKDMYINGVKEWPCRGIQLSSKVVYPMKFSYTCFRLTPHSVYAINATVLPQKCRVSTIFTSPSFDDFFPEMLVDPAVSQKTISSTDPFWSPTIAADFSDDYAIWIRLGKAPRAECDTININVYKEHEDNKISFLKTLSVKCPENAVKWEDQDAGKYLLTAYVPIRGCKFFCDSKARGCSQCLRTHLNLVIKENRASLVWLAVQTFKDYSFEIFIALLILICIFILIALAILIAYYRKQKRDAARVREIQLQEFVKTMIVYADDNEHHTNCVTVLVDNLRHCANCDPVFDLEKLITAERIVPSRWLLDQLTTLPKFIIVVSDCAAKILDLEASETHHLIQSRPFADLFGPAIDIIIGDATRNPTTARKKYAIVRFNYSPQVPANLKALNLPTFYLPDQFGHLTAFIHDLEHADTLRITQNISDGRINDWKVAIARQVSYVEQNPDWLDSRWKQKDEQAMMSLKRESPVILKFESNEDRIAASLKYNVLPPKADDEDEEESEASNDENAFMIQPPRHESDEESSEDDVNDEEEEEEEEGSNTIVAFNS